MELKCLRLRLRDTSGRGSTRFPQVFRGTSWDSPRAAFKWTSLLAQEGNTCKCPEKWLKKRTGLGASLYRGRDYWVL